MQTIFEEYGGMIIAILGGLLILFIFIDSLSSGGSLNEIIQEYIESAC